jgi:hypothetical protein
MRSVLSDAITASEPPVHSGPAQVFERARKIQNRQRFAATGSVLAVIAIAVFAFTATANGPDTGAEQSSPRMDLIKSMLPGEAQVASAEETGDLGPPSIVGRLTLTDGQGTTLVRYSVLPDQTFPAADHTCPAPQGVEQDWICVNEVQADGTTLRINQMRQTAGGPLMQAVFFVRQDGIVVAVVADTAAGGVALLAIDRLKAMAIALSKIS